MKVLFSVHDFIVSNVQTSQLFFHPHLLNSSSST